MVLNEEEKKPFLGTASICFVFIFILFLFIIFWNYNFILCCFAINIFTYLNDSLIVDNQIKKTITETNNSKKLLQKTEL